MGKTEKGAVWLNEKLFTIYDYWQFWRNTDDNDVKKFLYYFTDIETDRLKQITSEEKDINKLKILLANEATCILYGKNASKKAERTALDTFRVGGVSKNLPEMKVAKTLLQNGVKILDLLSTNNIINSKSEARRIIKNNGVKIDNEVLVDENKIINLNDFSSKEFIKISVGKKKHYLLKII